MTVTNENSRNDYVSNGSAVEYAFTFKILDEADIQVIVTDLAGVEDLLVLTTDYTVDLDADTGLGSITLVTAATVNFTISLLRNMDFEQNTSIQNQGTSQFSGKSFEQALDKLTLLSLQLKEIVGRNIALKKSSLLSGITISDPVANKLLVVDADGNIDMSDSDFTNIEANLAIIIANIADVNAIAADIANIDLVAGDLANIDIVAGISAAIVTNLPDIQNAASFNFPTLVSTDALKTIRVNSTYNGYEVIEPFSNRNLLVNPQGRVSQQATTITSTSVPANSDDTYILDVINQVSDGNDICDYSQETTTVPTGSPMSIKCDQETANKQWGLVWFLPADEAAKIVGGVASLQFKARKGGSNATLGKLRAAIISWSSTADFITSDVVGTWAGGGTNPTLASNWTYENTPSNLTLTTSFQTFKIENVAIDTASAKNVGVFIWLDDTNATVADLAYIADVQLEAGSVCTPFDCRPIPLENIVVRHLFETHEGNSLSFMGFTGSFEGNSRGNIQIPFFPKRISPTLSSSAATTFRVAQGTTSAQGSSIVDLSWQPQINCASLDINAGAIFTNGLASRITGFGATLTYIRADARL
ncbi:hypothetical protein UFOVP1451_2 [uncultured Caudovirales phage]|uniref:Uncharacterized protein n=1 Tax=uncultured Caudovirales phage TaxID=2100421 RepID=A0A6J5SG94_9CAUD|nr:hypothetical protein UFOVP1451_2 [uncultured Caudovirales phage]